MNPFKRITVSINASLDQFIRQVENHEALADASLREIESAAGRLRAQHRKLQLGSERMQSRIDGLARNRDLWVERARKLHASHETASQDAALECVRRLKAEEKEHAQLLVRKKEQEETVHQLSTELASVEEKLRSLRLRRNALAGQQAQAEAINAIEKVQSQDDSEGILDRWETTIEAKTPFRLPDAGKDPFEARLLKEEEKAELKDTLERIVRK